MSLAPIHTMIKNDFQKAHEACSPEMVQLTALLLALKMFEKNRRAHTSMQDWIQKTKLSIDKLQPHLSQKDSQKCQEFASSLLKQTALAERERETMALLLAGGLLLSVSKL